MSVKLYVEGGGGGNNQKKSKKLMSRCRKGFASFIEKAGLKGKMPRIVPCGGRDMALKKFKAALSQSNETALLLVDSEEPVKLTVPWQHLKDRDGWDRPAGATDDQCHLMVQVMESWFLADRGALGAFYGQGFREGSLPQNQNIEQIPKADVIGGLELATKDTSKGRYDKGKHSFEILGNLNPTHVVNASSYAKCLVEALQVKSQT